MQLGGEESLPIRYVFKHYDMKMIDWLRTLAGFALILNKLQHTCFIISHFSPYIAKYYAL